MRTKQSNRSLENDQAEGLRRLLVRGLPQVITVLSGRAGMGRTCTISNLATAIAQCGKRVLVLDENRLASYFQVREGARARYDLLDIALEKCKLSDAIFTQNGYALLSTKRALSSLAQMRHIEKLRIESALAELNSSVDVMLVDAAVPSLINPLAMRLGYQKSIVSALVMSQAEGLLRKVDKFNDAISCHSLMLVVDGTSRGITDSYVMMKRLAQDNANLKFEIVINKVSDEQVALKIFANMEKVASLNVAAQLDYLGCIPVDEKLKKASQLGLSAFDIHPAASSAKSYTLLCKKIIGFEAKPPQDAIAASSVIKNLMRHISQPLQQSNQHIVQLIH
jgi:flagellar biosynthesis protein FlhG